MDFDAELKLLLLGNQGVGKTNIVRRFSGDVFSPHYISTIGVDCVVRYLTIYQHVYKINCWDTAGQERFRSITRAYYRGAHLILVVYDVSNRQSYNDVAQWIKDVDADVPIVIVGNKTDLNPNVICDQDVQRDYPNIPHFQCSCIVPGSVDYTMSCILEHHVANQFIHMNPSTPIKRPSQECCTIS